MCCTGIWYCGVFCTSVFCTEVLYGATSPVGEAGGRRIAFLATSVPKLVLEDGYELCVTGPALQSYAWSYGFVRSEPCMVLRLYLYCATRVLVLSYCSVQRFFCTELRYGATQAAVEEDDSFWDHVRHIKGPRP
eukprot:782603-Rhodomonas_salina.1